MFKIADLSSERWVYNDNGISPLDDNGETCGYVLWIEGSFLKFDKNKITNKSDFCQAIKENCRQEQSIQLDIYAKNYGK